MLSCNKSWHEYKFATITAKLNIEKSGTALNTVPYLCFFHYFRKVRPVLNLESSNIAHALLKPRYPRQPVYRFIHSR